MIEFKMPALGADVEKGTLLEWYVKPGDAVKRGQVVALVDTSKAAIDIESWQEGTVGRLLTQIGETVEAGAVMALLLQPGESPELALAFAQPSTVEVQKAAPSPPPSAAAAVPSATEERRKISPAARRRAVELGVDLNALPSGTGPHQSITVQDVERTAAKSTTKPELDRTAAMRRTIAAAMARSKREIPHYYLSEPIPLQKLTEWMERENKQRPIDTRLLIAVPLLKAVALVLKRFPELNGFYRDEQFTPATGIHAGIAISLRQGGLIAPALHDVDSKSLDTLMTEMSDLIARARAGSLRSSELADATVTVTSLGEQGVEAVFGVIYPPQVALIGFGRIAPRPWIVDGTVQAVPVIHASLAADHRASDGHRGARFLAALRDRLQQPETL
jgi:pyruvate dehydrogenase E2 component (dihydrolipoamide acetyltransferase)